ncbi:hypothetical protein ACJMK2_008291 [Sinanodonta woodiana]|uniref:TraB domain-containing protein n=1 Tax=Sinanodonta woodiana TaxID=1069815 RepID=A0ABD3VNP0_SINWO
MEIDKNEDASSSEIQEKISDKSMDPRKEPFKDKDRNSPKCKTKGIYMTVEEDQGDNARHACSDDIVSVKEPENAKAPTTEHILSIDPSNLNLPSTVTVLDTNWGSRVYVVGTHHFSLESQEDVAKTIRATQPNVVVMELCLSRIYVLLLDEKTHFEKEKNISLRTMIRVIKQDGFMHGLMKILFLSRNARRTKIFGMASGGEFRRAMQEAQLVPNCKVHLGDRLSCITFKRCLHASSFFEKLKFIWHLITSKGPISQDVEKLLRKDSISEILTNMRREFPNFTRVFIEEKNIFLANSLKFAAQPIHLSTGDQMPTVVVGVVGMAHVPGIVDVWKQNVYDIRNIMTVPEESMIMNFWGISMVAGFIGLISYGCFQLYKLT